jgi:hypothetical protein
MEEKSTYWRVIKSVMASFIGIQSEKNLEKDAESNIAGRFFVVGIILAVFIHGLLYLIAWSISWYTGVK